MDILLVDNDFIEIDMISEIVKAKGSEYNLVIFHNGIDAADYLFNLPPFTNSKRPDIIILKSKTPGKKGIELLSEVKQSHLFHDTVVVIVAESPSSKEESFAHHMGADGYFLKPEDSYGYLDLMNGILSLPASN